MRKSQLDQLLDESSKIIKRNIHNPQIRSGFKWHFDFESKIYREGLKDDLLLVKKYLPKNGCFKILDVGCGKGHISVLL